MIQKCIKLFRKILIYGIVIFCVVGNQFGYRLQCIGNFPLSFFFCLKRRILLTQKIWHKYFFPQNVILGKFTRDFCLRYVVHKVVWLYILFIYFHYFCQVIHTVVVENVWSILIPPILRLPWQTTIVIFKTFVSFFDDGAQWQNINLMGMTSNFNNNRWPYNWKGQDYFARFMVLGGF